MLKGKLITLLPLEETHQQELGRILNDDETMESLFPYFHTRVWTQEMIAERYRRFRQCMIEGTGLNLVVSLNETGEVAGECGFKDINNGDGEFGIIIHHKHWGTGVARECHLLALDHGFVKKKFKCVRFQTDQNNRRMQGFFEKAGIPLVAKSAEGTLRYELHSEDWASIKKKLM